MNLLLPDFWPVYKAWRPEFAKAIDESLYPLPWLDGQVFLGRLMFDHVEDAAILSRYETYPSGAFDVHGMVAAGSPEVIRDVLIPHVEARARARGAVGATIASRSAWAKLLKPSGYEPRQLSIRKVF